MTKRTDEETWIAACEDLLDWEEENDALLPNGMTEQEIAGLEADGFVVDLVTGDVMTEQEAEARTWKL